MSDNHDKPSDPDATVSLPPRKPAVDDDATVSISSRDVLKAPDDDATVSISSRDVLKAPDEDATVSISSRDALKEPTDDDATVTNMSRDAFLAPKEETEAKSAVDEDATVSMPPGGFKIPSEATATATAAAAVAAVGAPPPPKGDGIGGVIGTSPASLTGEPSRVPMIAGGIVVFLVLLYFLFGGGAKTPPEGSKSSAPLGPQTTAPAAPSASAPAPAPAPSVPASTSPGKTSAKDLLAADIKRGAVAVQEEGGVATITILLSQQFASGGIEPEPKLRAILLGVAAALDKANGPIVVTGHADSTPSSNPKFPSNQDLSAARGAAAAKVMAGKLSDPKRISSDGMSDSKPLAPSDTVENRAKNRRVVIVLKPAT